MIDRQAYPAVEKILQIFKVEIYSIAGKAVGPASQVKKIC